MSYEIYLAARAQRDVEEVVSWLAERSPAAAQVWYESCLESIRSLGEMPERYPVAFRTRTPFTEVRSLLVGMHRLFFVIREKSVEVLHVRHTRRHPLVGSLLDTPSDDEEEQSR